LSKHRVLLIFVAAVALFAACRPLPPPLPDAKDGASGAPVLVDVNPDPAVVDQRVIDMPDPFVLRVDPSYCDTGTGRPPACYYAYTTQVFFNAVPVYRSSDLLHWETAGADVPAHPHPWPNGGALGGIAPWAEPIGYWGPSVLARPANPVGSRYVMWYAAASHAAGTAGLHCLGVAVADTPDGPFVDTATAPAYCQPTEGGTIDPSPFVDNDGTAYLTYKTEGQSFPYVPTRLWISRLTPDGRSIVPGAERLLLEVDSTPGNWEHPIIEAPTMMRAPTGAVFLFFSAYYWETADYKVSVARCDSPLGPCSRVYRTPVLASRQLMLGPGGQTPFADAAGNWYLAFHAWAAPNVGYPVGGLRIMRILPLTFPTGSPVVG
jgi:beta-xylosidase